MNNEPSNSFLGRGSMSVPRPIIKYHGSKWRIAPWIIEQFPPHRIYVEPFGGGGSVLFRKPRSEMEVINDLSDDLFNLFRVLQTPWRARILAARLWTTPYARREYERAFVLTRRSIERARRLILRSRMGHGSAANLGRSTTGFRSRCWRAGTPETAVWVKIPDEIRQYTERLRGVNIEHRDALEVIMQHDYTETLFYVDPPYISQTRTSISRGAKSTRMYSHDMTDEDHGKLLATVKNLKGMVIISGYRSPLYDAELTGWRRMEKHSRTEFGAARTECLWISPNIPRKQKELFS